MSTPYFYNKSNKFLTAIIKIVTLPISFIR